MLLKIKVILLYVKFTHLSRLKSNKIEIKSKILTIYEKTLIKRLDF